jgi:hypothetical protein
MRTRFFVFCACLLLAAAFAAAFVVPPSGGITEARRIPAEAGTTNKATNDRVLFDFESGTFDGWTMEGKETFGPAPFDASAEVPQWVEHRGFTGWQGKFIVIVGDTRHGITAPGRMMSDEFAVTHRYLKFLYGGEVHPRVRVYLTVDGREVRTAYGNNSYDMRLRGWDVGEFKGRRARIVVEDTCETASLVRLDYFHLSDTPPPKVGAFDQSKQESDLVRYGELKPLYDPGVGLCLASHSITKGPDGRWHIFATLANTRDRYKPENHREIIHLAADKLAGPWAKQPGGLTPDAKLGEQFLWDPFVVVHDRTYYLFYVGAGNHWKGWRDCGDTPPPAVYQGKGMCGEHGPFEIHLAVSRDGRRWERKGKVVADAPFAFTPFVHRLDDRWQMFYASADPPSVYGKHAIVHRTSKDLVAWGERSVAIKDEGKTTPWPENSMVRSPVVVRRGPHWYLLAGPMDNLNQSRFHYLKVHRGDNPYRWDFKQDGRNKGLFLEGGAKVIRDDDGKYYVTHAGLYAGGVWLAPLYWNDGVK